MTQQDPTPQDVLQFWFHEIRPQQWWLKSDEFDAGVRARFGAVLEAARRCELFAWRASVQGRLAEILVLDQFSRNIHRGQPQSFAADGLALCLAQEAVARGLELSLDPTRRAFLLMPYMHSESLRIHDEALRLFDAPGLEDQLAFERRHRDIIERFGRYPHRNAILGRASTPEEAAFLQTPGSSF